MELVRQATRAPDEAGGPDLVGAPDVRSFWTEAVTWTWRALLLTVAGKVGLTLLVAAAQGRTPELRLWRRVLPYFVFEVDEPTFVRIVTMSTWLGVAAVALVIAWSELHRRRRRRRFAASIAEREDDDPIDDRLPYERFVLGARLSGVRFGALFGSLTLPMTILCELVRDRFIDTYVWPRPHLIALSLAGAPVVGLIAMWAFGAFARRTEPFRVIVSGPAPSPAPIAGPLPERAAVGPVPAVV